MSKEVIREQGRSFKHITIQVLGIRVLSYTNAGLLGMDSSLRCGCAFLASLFLTIDKRNTDQSNKIDKILGAINNIESYNFHKSLLHIVSAPPENEKKTSIFLNNVYFFYF